MRDGSTTTDLGRQGEAIAAQALQAHGFRIVEKNWRYLGGEIDLVAQDGDIWVFVEVKLRRSAAFGSPEEAVTQTKQRRLLSAGSAYLSAIDLNEAIWRIDIVAIEMTPQGKVRRLSIHQDAIRADE